MAGYHHVEHVMGMAVSIAVHDDVEGTPGLVELISWLHHVDATFSTYIEDSPISQLGRGELALADASDEIRHVLLQCEAIRLDTGGAFDAFAVPAPNGTTLDPSGLVKGWSIERGAALLERHGLHDFSINAGGDIAVRGAPRPDPAWRVGIRHPDDAQSLAAVIELRGPISVATSATYERGAHIIDPHTGQPTTDVASVTIVGPDLTLADAYATAVFVMGLDGLEWLDTHRDYDGLVLTHDGAQHTSPGFDRWRAALPAR